MKNILFLFLLLPFICQAQTSSSLKFEQIDSENYYAVTTESIATADGNSREIVTRERLTNEQVTERIKALYAQNNFEQVRVSNVLTALESKKQELLITAQTLGIELESKPQTRSVRSFSDTPLSEVIIPKPINKSKTKSKKSN